MIEEEVEYGYNVYKLIQTGGQTPYDFKTPGPFNETPGGF